MELTGSRPAELEGTAWVWHDVSAQTDLSDQLRRHAFQDDLTGLANRALLRDRTTMALAEPSSVSMLLVDVDRFQQLNDAFGHAVGDEILRALAGRIRACVRPGDTVARLGESVLLVGPTLGLKTLAEGIEDIATCETLRMIGCDKGQGFLFSRPVEGSEASALTRAVFPASALVLQK